MSGGEPRAEPPPAAPRRVETARMVLSAPGASDAADVVALRGDPRVGRWLGGTLDPAAAQAALVRWMSHWGAHGFGLWVARDRATGALVGYGGLSTMVVGGRAEVEVGWTIAAERWGEGLATELGAAAMEVAADPLGALTVISLTMPDNTRSRRVMEKLGLTYEREVTHRGLPHVLYRRTRTRADHERRPRRG